MGTVVKKRRALESAISDKESTGGALARGLAVLREMLTAPQPLTLVEISALSKLDQSTTLRLLRSLESSGYVVRLEDSKRYAPAPQTLFPLPFLHPLDRIRRETQPILERLAQTFGETSVLILFVGTRRVVVDIAQSPNSLAPLYSNWQEGPLHATSSGKVLLAGMSSAERKSLLGPEPYSRETTSTITDFATLDAEVELTAARGYATAVDEQLMGMTAIAATIPGRNRRNIGCLCATGHSRAFDGDRIEQLGREFVAAAKLMPLQAVSLRSAAHFLGHG